MSCFSMSVSCFVYLVLPVVSHYFTDQLVAITCEDMLQCANKDWEKDCKLVHIHVNHAGFKILKRSAPHYFDTSFRAQYTIVFIGE